MQEQHHASVRSIKRLFTRAFWSADECHAPVPDASLLHLLTSPASDFLGVATHHTNPVTEKPTNGCASAKRLVPPILDMGGIEIKL